MDAVPTRVLFVCTGNICRSPTAEGIARHWMMQHGLSARYEIDSAATQSYHTGEAPDMRAQKAAARRGYDLSPLRARPLCDPDYVEFDYILAMGHDHLQVLREQCPAIYLPKLSLMRTHACPPSNQDVPDPYYGGPGGFETVLDVLESAVHGFFETLETARKA